MAAAGFIQPALSRVAAWRSDPGSSDRDPQPVIYRSVDPVNRLPPASNRRIQNRPNRPPPHAIDPNMGHTHTAMGPTKNKPSDNQWARRAKNRGPRRSFGRRPNAPSASCKARPACIPIWRENLHVKGIVVLVGMAAAWFGCRPDARTLWIRSGRCRVADDEEHELHFTSTAAGCFRVGLLWAQGNFLPRAPLVHT